jgi:RNA ligase (TIGR02306 family)
MSTHSVNVIEIEAVLPHGNAERLEIVPVGGWQAVVKKGQFRPGDRAVYIEPDYLVPTNRPEFEFLAKDGRDRHRLKAVRLRGELSFGLLIPVPGDIADRDPGTNVMGELGIERWEPVVKITMADELPQDQWPETYAPKFDIESYEKFPHVIRDGEMVIVTEKVHGANARYVFVDGVFYLGSRNRWLIPDGDHVWARAARSVPSIREWCEANPGSVLYGEAFGNVQSLKYGRMKGEISFIAFAASMKGQWLDQPALFRALESYGVPTAPVVYEGPFDHDHIRTVAEKDSKVSLTRGDMMEGVVICPATERFHASIGRVAVKHISNRYWESEA